MLFPHFIFQAPEYHSHSYSFISSWPISALSSSSCHGCATPLTVLIWFGKKKIKKSQPRLGRDTVEASDSDLQGNTVKAWIPYSSSPSWLRCCLTDREEERLAPTAAESWHRFQNLQRYQCTTPPGTINTLPARAEDINPDLVKYLWGKRLKWIRPIALMNDLGKYRQRSFREIVTGGTKVYFS